MTLDSVRKAAHVMMNKKAIDSYDLPERIKRRISKRQYTEAEINLNYRESRKSRIDVP